MASRKSTNPNTALFKKLSNFQGQSLEINLNSDFDASMDAFRSVTSRMRRINGQNYPAVYLTDSDYGGLTFNFGRGRKLQLIMNLEFYYVYGFLIGTKVYGFQGEATAGLESLGFTVTPISYGDSYTDIQEQSVKEGLPDVKTKKVRLSTLLQSMSNIINPSISFDLKSNDILVTFWSLIEGIRFAKISNTIEDLLVEHPVNAIYDEFYKLAENWANLSVDAANKGVLNPAIAVYELHRIHRHTGEQKS